MFIIGNVQAGKSKRWRGMKGCFLSSPPDFDSDDVFAVAV